MSDDGGSALGTIRSNWRITLLVIAVLVSLFFLFGPQPGGGGDANATAGPATSGPTNLEYGLELAGGSRVQAPLVGWTLTEAAVGVDNRTQATERIASGIDGADAGDVVAVAPDGTSTDQWAIEVRANVSRDEVRQAANAAEVSYADLRQGVTRDTRSQTVEVLQTKIDATGLQGGRVRTSYSVSEQQYFVVVEVPNANSSEVRGLLDERGELEVLAYAERNDTYENRTVLTNEDIQEVGIAQENPETGPHVPIVVDSGAAQEFQQAMVETGIARSGGSGCGWPGGNGTCMLIVRDGTVISARGMSPRLAGSMVEGTWANDPRFILPTRNLSEAQDLAILLRAGELPTGLALDDGTSQFVSATFGADARLNSVIAAIAAVLAVALVVFLRFGDPRVAAPMVLTALSEVVLLLGFAAAVGLALDLGHIAGFIAVIGTGVDDLVIIADDILREGDVATDRVFRSRFRKALWVIGAAAATTIIAMTPLAVLSLQQLRGFAIVTIVGVLLGVFVTRPAYGDILRNLRMGEQ